MPNTVLIEMMEKELERKREEVVALEQSLSVLKGDKITHRDLQLLPKSREFEHTGITEATKQLLREKGPMSTRDLADTMLDRGIKTRSKNYVATVYATLENSSAFKRTKDGNWELVEEKK